ncbi:MAG: DNA repair protein RecO [Ruminococcaceae bacterium]|nr:DNA repair protein RecO [Oscillospiraceae bacterium]
MRTAINGLVLREMNSGENDKLLLVLTAEQGKIWISAKGGRSIKSKKSAICRAFTYAEFEIYEKNNIIYLSGGSPIKTFFAYKTDLNGYALACYVTTVCEEITGEDTEAEQILRTTLNTFYAIENQLYPIEQIKAAYELFAASISGFSPDLSVCEKCGKKFNESDNLWLDVMNGCLLCNECKSKNPSNTYKEEIHVDEYETRNLLMPLDAPSLMAMRYCVQAPAQRLFSFSIKSENSAELFYRAAENYLLNHLERGFETLNFYYKIKD